MPRKKLEKENCEKATVNPACPYITQITAATAASTAAANIANASLTQIAKQGEDIIKIRNALIGKDLDKVGGIVKRLDEMESKLEKIQSFWNFFKPIAVSVLITIITVYGLARVF